MSGDEEKSEDKKEIEDEEREKILNDENKREQEGDQQPEGEVQKMRKALEECEKDRDGKKKVPIGGIKIPGFLKSKSRDKCKDGEHDVEEGKDLLQDSAVPTVATAQTKDRGSEDKPATGSRKPLLATIMINNPFGKKKDLEQGGAAGLASMETLDDSSGVDKAADPGDDGMESVKLDSDDKLDVDKAEDVDNVQKPFWPAHFDIRNKLHMIICAAVVFFVLLVIVIAVAASSRQESWPMPLDGSPLVETYTTCGPIQGRAEGGAYVFWRVPYAAPPLGELRFRPAQPLDDIRYCWNGTRAAQTAPQHCLQTLDNGSLIGSEDCLTLDIFTPRLGFENPIPVVVVIAAESLARSYPMAVGPKPALARSQDVVLVRVNFRLGVLGFLAAEALSQSVHPPTSGNYALSDLVVALQWLQMNIQVPTHSFYLSYWSWAFNGNNNSVTLLGHGAGATLVTTLCAQPRARRLFTRAWVSGGAGVLPREGSGPVEAYERYVRSLPCRQENSVNCLQNLEAHTLLEKVPPEWMRPFKRLGETQHSWLVVDGVYLRDGFQEVWAIADNLPIVPVVVGAAAHSDVPSAEGHSPEAWDANNGRLVREQLASGPLVQWAEEALRRYGATWRGYVSLLSDLRTICPLAELARLRPGTAFYLANHTRGPAHLADARSDLDAILGVYGPGEGRFAAIIQDMFFGFVRGSSAVLEKFHSGGRSSEVPLERRKGYEAVIFVDESAVTHPDYPHCTYWSTRNVTGKFARRD